MQTLKYKLDRRTLENIYFTFVRPKLEYASIIWDDCTEGNKLKLENVQLGFARVVTGAKRGTSHELLYNETSWPTLSSRRNNVKMKFMHGVVHGKAPDYLCNLISLTDDNDVAYDFRNKENVTQFSFRTEKFRKSLFPDCIRKWNELPVDLWKIVKLDDFMNEITIPLKSNNLYYGIKRKLGVIHSQFRMQCSNLKGDLHSLHVVDDPVCICSNQIENCEHFFFHCYLYATQRVAFLARLRGICSVDITTDLLLFGSNELDSDVNCQIF